MSKNPDFLDIIIYTFVKVIIEENRKHKKKIRILKDEKPYIDVEAKVIEGK